MQRKGFIYEGKTENVAECSGTNLLYKCEVWVLNVTVKRNLEAMKMLILCKEFRA